MNYASNEHADNGIDLLKWILMSTTFGNKYRMILVWWSPVTTACCVPSIYLRIYTIVHYILKTIGSDHDPGQWLTTEAVKPKDLCNICSMKSSLVS